MLLIRTEGKKMRVYVIGEDRVARENFGPIKVLECLNPCIFTVKLMPYNVTRYDFGSVASSQCHTPQIGKW